MAFVLPPVRPVSGGTIGVEAPARVEVARSQQEARDSIEKALPGAGGRLLLVSQNDYLSSLLLPMRRSGVLKELVTILPFDNVLVEQHLEGARSFFDQAGLPAGDRDSLRLDNGVIRGTVEGMPVVLATLPAFPSLPETQVLAVDTPFFPALYRNEVRTPMVHLARKLVLTLRERKVRANAVVLLDGTGRGDFPLEHGFLAAFLLDMISRPDAFAADLPEKWATLAAADQAYAFSQYAEGMTLYRSYLGDTPNDASACYKIAVLASRDLDVELVIHWLNRAVTIDPLYRRTFPELAGYFYRKEMYDGSERILLAGLSKFPKDQSMATNLVALYLTRGEGALEAGDGESAAEFYRMAVAVEGAEPQMRERARRMAESLSSPSQAPN